LEENESERGKYVVKRFGWGLSCYRAGKGLSGMKMALGFRA